MCKPVVRKITKTDRPCGCGARGRHKPTCSLANTVAVKEKTVVQARTCGCSLRGRHSKDCILKEEFNAVVPDEILKDPSAYMNYLFNKYYGKPPQVSWVFGKDKQTTVEKRITKLIKKYKPMYLTVTKPNETIEEWFVDGGNWVTSKDETGQYSKILGHVANVLPFLKNNGTVWDMVAGKKSSRKRK